MRIINIGTPLKGTDKYDVSNVNLFSNFTLLDAELIFWDVHSSRQYLPGNSKLINSIPPNEFIKIKSQIEKVKIELEEFFEIGRTLIITNPIFYEHKYTILNKDEEKKLDLIECIGINKPQLESISGKSISPINESFANHYLKYTCKNFTYDYKFLNPKGFPLMKIKDTDYIISQFFRVKNGLIIFFPNFNFPSQRLNEIDGYLFYTINLIKDLKKYHDQNKLEIPNWVEEYLLPGEKEEQNKLENLKIKLNSVQDSITNQKNQLIEIQRSKALFACDGEAFEEAVKFVFEAMGFEVEKSNENRDDLIIKIGKKVAVIEAKGLTKSSAEKNVAQLQKWVTNYHIENGVNPKGILIVNTYKNEKLENRDKVNFPDQMLKYVKQMNHCLLTGVQLLCIYSDFKNKKLRQSKIIDMLFNSVGELKYIDNPLELINLKS